MNQVDEYIFGFSEDRQKRLQEIRKIIMKYAGEATEKISWGMPTFYLHGNLVHFAMNKNHIGFYPGASGVENFLDRLGDFKHSKGAIQFPLSEEFPKELIRDIVQFRVKENMDLYSRKQKG